MEKEGCKGKRIKCIKNIKKYLRYRECWGKILYRTTEEVQNAV